jgi:hypothetical protein
MKRRNSLLRICAPGDHRAFTLHASRLEREYYTWGAPSNILVYTIDYRGNEQYVGLVSSWDGAYVEWADVPKTNIYVG